LVFGALALAAWLVPCSTEAGPPSKEKPYALIFGTVFDPNGQSVYGVKVKIRRADQKKAHWELYSDHRGEFAQRVPAGKSDYVVWADFKDYKLPSGKHLKPGTEVTVHIENAERSDIGLHLIW
jgi:hypothetical protein